ncbi:hypothetical protein GCM10023206_11420 [Acinetobacter puyangensis]|uniref:AAA domain-containing protein n=1 Tax=Acinetobacter puyangensis TaxID=1096779 RepID=A0A240EA02_9GAMM|nr:AAA family ATPase [Acinetobacter puyangensis]SNX45548.1 hypothetical protein SAMN05421731_105102 [Acinetobacter puyangensis]
MNVHINPDHYLQTAQGRVFSEAGNRLAWQKCYADLQHYLSSASAIRCIYLLVGAQGSGKTSWVKHKMQVETDCIFFDAILVKKSERMPILQYAQQFDLPCVAVCLMTSLQQCLERNRQRPTDEIVNTMALRNVYQAYEQPTLEEGFADILFITPELNVQR